MIDTVEFTVVQLFVQIEHVLFDVRPEAVLVGHDLAHQVLLEFDLAEIAQASERWSMLVLVVLQRLLLEQTDDRLDKLAILLHVGL